MSHALHETSWGGPPCPSSPYGSEGLHYTSTEWSDEWLCRVLHESLCSEPAYPSHYGLEGEAPPYVW